MVFSASLWRFSRFIISVGLCPNTRYIIPGPLAVCPGPLISYIPIGPGYCLELYCGPGRRIVSGLLWICSEKGSIR